MNTIAGKPLAATQVVPLLEAVLCVDCEMVSNSTQGHCLACGSRALLNLAAALGGPLHSNSAAVADADPMVTGPVLVIRSQRRVIRR
ncbi:MAG TPA: hypothetical protein VE998_08580 [Terriglobales bacterium]|nr:hypothetical protein [Terriglobales bacterium]